LADEGAERPAACEKQLKQTAAGILTLGRWITNTRLSAGLSPNQRR
jgi:hypothetical protein